MKKILILEEKQKFLSWDNKKILQKTIPTNRLGFVGPCDRKHTYFFD